MNKIWILILPIITRVTCACIFLLNSFYSCMNVILKNLSSITYRQYSFNKKNIFLITLFQTKKKSVSNNLSHFNKVIKIVLSISTFYNKPHLLNSNLC